MHDVKNTEEYKRLLERANYDDLTRVLNRRGGREYLEDQLDRARDEKKTLVIALCDVNDLKHVNDRYGHKEGDSMLCQVASAMVRNLAADDFVFRLSGDEFVAVLYDMGQHEADQRIKDILTYLAEKKNHCGLPYDITFSYGLVEVYPEEKYTVSDLIEKADMRMYIQKRDYHIMRAKQKMQQWNNEEIHQFVYDKEHLYDALAESTDDYVFAGNMKTGTFRYPPSMVKEFGLPGEVVENAAAFWSEKIHPDDKKVFLESNQEIADGRSEYHDIEYRAKNVSGRWIWLRCRGRMIPDESLRPQLFAGTITNLGRSSQTDHMTGLSNRFEFEGDTKKYLVDDKVIESIGIMILDMDGFHTINDLYNRSFGDAILKMTAQKITELLPDNAKAYRMDGDEFAILIKNGTKEDALEIFGKIQQTFQKSREYKGRKYYCTISGGYAAYPEDSDEYLELLQYANYSLESSKAKGKNRITIFAPDILQNKGRTLEMTELLRESIERGFAGFSLHYQPQVDTKTGHLYGAEALARWQCGTLGNVPPGEFIRILEQTGMIIPTGKWIFKEAARQCRDWVKVRPDFHMSINLSYLQMLEEDFVSFVWATLEELGLPKKHITLELTETYLIEQDILVHDIMECLQAEGIKAAMDDFGAGYSSLFELKNTPADIVKIDRGFVKGLTTDLFTSTFIKSITELCHDVGKTVCMEGVETKEAYEVTRQIGVDLIQGYYFGKPVTPEIFVKEFLSTNSR